MRNFDCALTMECHWWTTTTSLRTITTSRIPLFVCSFYFWLAIAMSLPQASLAGLERPHYRTAYACEGSMLYIGCDDGQLIHLIRANYGRFSITICNEHGNTDWSVNCIAPRSFRVLQERCHQVSKCSVNVTSTIFDDPCPGTFKYLEVQYNCSLASTTTASTPARFAPPWLQPTTQPPWVTLVTRPNLPPDGVPPANIDSPSVVAAATVTPTRPSDSAVDSTDITTSLSVTSSTLKPSLVVSSSDNATVQQSVSSSTSHIVPAKNSTEAPGLVVAAAAASPLPTQTSGTITIPTTLSTTIRWEVRENYCSESKVRDLYWNWTKHGEMAVIPCPTGTTGYAKRRCGSNPIGWIENPDLSDCKSMWVTSLANSVENRHSLVGVAVELVQLSKKEDLYGGDIVEAATLLKKMAHKMSERVKMSTGSHREDLVKELMKPVVETGSNLLSDKQRGKWNDLSRQMQMKTAAALLLGLEENAYLLADQVNYEKDIVQSDDNILMSIKVVRTQNIRDLNFPEPEDLSNSVWSTTGGGDMISLPSEALRDRAVNGFVKVIFFTYNNLDELLQPSPSNWPAQSSSDNNNISNNIRGTKMLNSKVISASFGRKHNQPLKQLVFVVLKHTQEENVSNPTCVYWDYSRSTWTPSGCEVVSTNRSHTICACNHLTNFALLMDVQGIQLSYGHEMALQVITYVGCMISIICLSLAFLTFSCFGGLNSDRNTIHKNLCACLLIAELLFVAGISQTDKPILCGVVAGLLHFFFLCSFAWMFLEGFQLYVMLIEVFESERSRVRWYYVVAYGTSALIVAISCIVDPFSYGTDKHCWLRADNYFIFSFVGPVIAILVANFVFLSIAVFMMCRHANSSASMKKKEHSRLANIKAWIRGALVLVFLLGLTWTFGLLYLNEETVIMAYVFTVLNSLQGLFIFVFHCLQNEKVQKEYRKLLIQSPCVPECVREVAKERRSSFYVNSNCTASVPNSSSTPVPSSGHLNHHQQHINHNQLAQHQQSYLKRLWGSGKMKNPQTSSLNGGLATRIPGTLGHPTATEPEVERFSSFKSSNRDRDSGHGGSEPEESMITLAGDGGNVGSAACVNGVVGINGSLRYNNNAKRNIKNGDITNDLSAMNCSIGDSDCSSEYFRDKLVSNDLQRGSARSLRHHNQNHAPQHYNHPSHHLNPQQQPHLHHHRQVRLSPLNHIYMDIESREGEPVYEEIDRSEAQQLSSDFSDEDGRRRSDISRQSSGSYGDNRPLISGQMGAQTPNRASLGHHHQHQHQLGLQLQNQQQQQRPNLVSSTDVPPTSYNAPPYHAGQMPPIPQPIVPHGIIMPNGYVDHQPTSVANDNSMFVAMLDGRKVVCRLQGRDQQQQHGVHQHHQQHYPTPPQQRLSHSEC